MLNKSNRAQEFVLPRQTVSVRRQAVLHQLQHHPCYTKVETHADADMPISVRMPQHPTFVIIASEIGESLWKMGGEEEATTESPSKTGPGPPHVVNREERREDDTAADEGNDDAVWGAVIESHIENVEDDYAGQDTAADCGIVIGCAPPSQVAEGHMGAVMAEYKST